MQQEKLIRISNSLSGFIDTVGRWVAWVALIHVVLVAINVILRYLFRVGPVAMQELEWHLLSPIALIGISYAMCHDDHVRVDILFEKFSLRLRRLIDFSAAAVAVVVSVIIIKISLGYVAQAYVAGEVSPDPGGLPYRYLLKSFVPLGFFLLAIQALAQCLSKGVALFERPGDG
jgi:TRAP-type mannitol/chloroaromatic compound transport system permease small subunit